ncbi:MAG: type II secretion system F family protein [Candidatus Omnitrophica bacterium]|nr:type II secretion system F family protein [Candidatus Omnitrophota bacterium]
MALFIYTARTKDGKIETGSLDMRDQDAALVTLQEKGLLVTSIISATPDKLVTKFNVKRKRYHYHVTLDDLVILARQMATLLDAGVPLLRCLAVVSNQLESHALERALALVRKDVEGGKALSESLKKYPRIFSPFWVNLVETGEASGQLPFVFDQIAKYMEEAGALQRKIISALIYPLILTFVAVGVITIFMVKIIPIFERIFSEFQVELPLLTRMIIGVSLFVRRNILIELLVIIGLVLGIRSMIKTERGRWLIDTWKLKVPVFGKLFEMVAVERFASAFSVMIKSGVPILYALEIVAKAADNRVIESALNKVKNAVRAGQSMSKPMAETGAFPPIVIEMIEVGEEAGELANMLARLGVFYKERIDTFVNRFASVFEPVVLVGMGIIVGVIVVSMFLPIFGISSAVKMQ